MKDLKFEKWLCQDRELSFVWVPREFLSRFFLQYQICLARRRPYIQDLANDVRGSVIRNVRKYLEVSLGDRKCKKVLFHYLDICMSGKSLTQPPDEYRVFFNRDDPRCYAYKFRRDYAFTGADFVNGIVLIDRARCHEALDEPWIFEKVLRKLNLFVPPFF